MSSKYPILPPSKIIKAMKKLGFEDKVRFGQVFSTDVFYKDQPDTLDWTKMGILAVEMEAAALYYTAARLGKNALAICSISDEVLTGVV